MGYAHPWDGPRREEGVRQGWREPGQLLRGWAGGERWEGRPGCRLASEKEKREGESGR
jgi:hypothetical protein